MAALSSTSNKAVRPPSAGTCSGCTDWQGAVPPKLQLATCLTKALKSSNVDLCHVVWVPSPQRFQKLIILPLQSWKHPWVRMKSFFNFLPHFFYLFPLPRNTCPDWNDITCYILIWWRVLSVTVNKIPRIIFKPVTSLTFIALFYRLCCCLVWLTDTCTFSVFSCSALLQSLRSDSF